MIKSMALDYDVDNDGKMILGGKLEPLQFNVTSTCNFRICLLCFDMLRKKSLSLYDILWTFPLYWRVFHSHVSFSVYESDDDCDQNLEVFSRCAS